jgi:hypothetical protein
MKLSRKRKKDLKRLRSSAEELWQEQQEVIDHASTVLRQASKQANLLTQEHVVPRVKDTYENRVKPTWDKSVNASRAVAGAARDKVTHDVVPAVTGVLGSALSVLELSKDVRAKLDAAGISAKAKAFSSALKKAPEPVKKSGPGAGTYALIALAVLALAGVAYAAWQTFRADDDLWIADDEPEATGSTNPTDVPKTPTA